MGSRSALMVKPSAMTTHWTVDRSASKYWAMVGEGDGHSAVIYDGGQSAERDGGEYPPAVCRLVD